MLDAFIVIHLFSRAGRGSVHALDRDTLSPIVATHARAKPAAHRADAGKSQAFCYGARRRPLSVAVPDVAALHPRYSLIVGMRRGLV